MIALLGLDETLTHTTSLDSSSAPHQGLHTAGRMCPSSLSCNYQLISFKNGTRPLLPFLSISQQLQKAILLIQLLSQPNSSTQDAS